MNTWQLGQLVHELAFGVAQPYFQCQLDAAWGHGFASDYNASRLDRFALYGLLALFILAMNHEQIRRIHRCFLMKKNRIRPTTMEPMATSV